MKKTRRFCCERALSISGTRRRLILVFKETPIANLRSFFCIVWNNVSNLNKKAWMMEQRTRSTELQRTVSGLFCVESRVSIAFPLFHLFTIVGDYIISSLGYISSFQYHVSDTVSVKCRLQTADCRLQTGGKMQTRGKMQTEHCRPGVKCRLNYKDYLFKVKHSTTHVLMFNSIMALYNELLNPILPFFLPSLLP